jgi:hypothetical protein
MYSLWRCLIPGMLLLVFLGTPGAGGMGMTKAEIEVTGRIYLMGNEPFTQVAVELDDGTVYALVGDRGKELRGLQGKRLIIRGRVSGKKAQGVEALQVQSYQIMEEQ